MAMTYEMSPTPSRAFPALKTPPPADPDPRPQSDERAMSRILSRFEAQALDNLERLMVLRAVASGLRRLAENG